MARVARRPRLRRADGARPQRRGAGLHADRWTSTSACPAASRWACCSTPPSGRARRKVTVLQMAMAYAAIANGGKLWVPQIVERVESPDGQDGAGVSRRACGGRSPHRPRRCSRCARRCRRGQRRRKGTSYARARARARRRRQDRHRAGPASATRKAPRATRTTATPGSPASRPRSNPKIAVVVLDRARRLRRQGVDADGDGDLRSLLPQGRTTSRRSDEAARRRRPRPTTRGGATRWPSPRFASCARKFDWPLFGAILAIVAIGLVNLYSATRVAPQGPLSEPADVVRRRWRRCSSSPRRVDYRTVRAARLRDLRRRRSCC